MALTRSRSVELSVARAFREELRRRLEQNRDRVLLRIVLSPAAAPVELTGGDILERAPKLALQYLRTPERGVVLLLLPHSVELFLLHLGLILEGRIPAILAWPTSRIDPEKYQRNLLHQLRNLPAQQLITLPQLAANLGGGLPYTTVACTLENAAQWEKGFAVPLKLDDTPPAASSEPAETAGDALFLQFSGGTTGAQ